MSTNPNQTEQISQSINKFFAWLEDYGFLSYDQFDFWGSKPGVFSKKLFYKNKLLASPIVGLLQILESFLPWSRRFFATRQRFAIGDAHFAMGYMNLYKMTHDETYLNKAKALLDLLKSSATQTPSGIGWGYPYTWVTRRAIYPPRTPFITVTPYCFDAFMEISRITQEKSYLDTIANIASFAAYDILETEISPDETAAGYGLGDKSQVINANAYRAALLLQTYQLLGITEYKEKAIKNIKFVLNHQCPDGSWPYAVNEDFIDNFHTCFVLKNLYKCYLIVKDEEIVNAVKKGYDYYRRFLFRKDDSPIHFAQAKHSKFRKIEMYDYAEGISLGILLQNEIHDALAFSLKLAQQLIHRFQLKDGHFVTRVSTLNTMNTIPYLRWPQAQLFYALTSIMVNT